MAESLPTVGTNDNTNSTHPTTATGSTQQQQPMESKTQQQPMGDNHNDQTMPSLELDATTSTNKPTLNQLSHKRRSLSLMSNASTSAPLTIPIINPPTVTAPQPVAPVMTESVNEDLSFDFTLPQFEGSSRTRIELGLHISSIYVHYFDYPFDLWYLYMIS